MNPNPNTKNKEFALSFELIKNVPFDKYDKDFTFIVDGKKYKTNRFVADLLSPTISNYHLTDESMNTYEITTNQSNKQFDFNDFLSLLSFEPVELDSNQQDYIKSIFLALDNITEYNRLEDVDENVVDSSTKKRSYVKELLKKVKVYTTNNIKNNNDKLSNLYYSDIFKKDIENIAKNFYKLKREDKLGIQSLPIELIDSILQNESLQLKDEDSLLRFINKIVKKNKENSFLYQYVQFEQVSDEELLHFYELFSMEYINQRIFESILNRSLQNNKDIDQYQIDSNRYHQSLHKNEKLFEFKEGQDFKGIIDYLTKKVGSNLHEAGLVEVSCNSFYDNPNNLLDFTETNCFQGGGVNDLYITYDFKDMKIKLSNYSIKSHKSGTHQLKSWVIETSNDKATWKKIDEHRNDKSMENFNGSTSFKADSDEFARYIRLHQIDEPWGGKNLWFHYIEFFGYLKEEQ